MTDRSIFISSCSRRELSRRRPSPNAYSLQLLLAMVVLFTALAVFVGSRVGF